MCSQMQHKRLLQKLTIAHVSSHCFGPPLLCHVTNCFLVCWRKYSGVCVKMSSGRCPFTGGSFSWEGCKTGHICCIPPTPPTARPSSSPSCGRPQVSDAVYVWSLNLKHFNFRSMVWAIFELLVAGALDGANGLGWSASAISAHIIAEQRLYQIDGYCPRLTASFFMSKVCIANLWKCS